MSINVMRLVFITPLVLKSHIHIVIIVTNLSTECKNSGLNDSFSLKKTIASPYQKEFEKAIYARFQFFIKNDTWKYENAPLGQAVLTGH